MQDEPGDRRGAGAAPHALRQHSQEFAHPALQQLDPQTSWLFQPRTITGLLLGAGILIYCSSALNPPGPLASPEAERARALSNYKAGLVACCCVYLGYAFFQGPTTCMVRPHPGVWRVLHGVVVIYLLVLTFLLFQTVDEARQLLTHLYPSLGRPLPERAYGADCRLWVAGQGVNWPAIKDTVWDEFVVAHSVGWWVKALIIRDRLMLWVLSIGFELMEKTFQHVLPNFNECWWDSWLLDVLICNWGGIWAGMRTVRWFGSKDYNWRGLSEQPTLAAKLRRGLGQFTPHDFQVFHWAKFRSPARFAQCCVPVAIVLTMEVNAFFLKSVLWLPPTNPLNVYRLLLLAVLALPATKEYYEFLEGPETDVFNKLGPFAWLGMAVVLTETLVVLKFGNPEYRRPFPPRVLWAWGLALGAGGAAYGAWCYRWYVRGEGRPERRAKKAL